MPLYQVEIPGRGKFKVESPTELTDEQAYAAVLQDIGNAPPPKKGLMAALGKGAESTLSGLRTGVGKYINPEEAAMAGLQRGEEISGKYADQTGLDKVKEAYEKQGVLSAAKEVGRQIPLALAEQAPNLAASFGGARLGVMAGSPLGVPGAIAGGVLGAFLPSKIQSLGGDIQRQAQEQIARGEPVKIDTAAAELASTGQGLLDVAGTFIPFGGKLVSKLTGIPEMAFFGKSAAQATKLADEKLLATLAKGTGVGVLAEVPTEIAQQMLERAQAGLSLTSPDAMKEYGETAYQAGLLGPLGAVGRFSEKGAARDEVAARQAAEQPPDNPPPPPPPPPPSAPEQEDSSSPPPPPPPPPAGVAVAPAVAPEVAPEPVTVPEAAPTPAAPTAIRETVRPGAVMGTMDTGAVPPAPPVPNLNRAMDEYDSLKIKLSGLQTQLQEAATAGDTAKINALYTQYEPLAKQVEASAQTIESLGGTTLTAAELQNQSTAALTSIDTKIKNAQKKLTDAAQLGSFNELPKLTAKLDELKQERVDLTENFSKQRSLLEEKQTNIEQRGQTRDLFTAEEAPVPVAETKEEAMAVEQPPTAAPAEAVKAQKVATPESTAAAEKIYTEIQDLEGQVARLRGREIPENADKIAKLNQLKSDYAAATKPSKLDTSSMDLFSEQNIINTAIQSGDQATLEKVANVQMEEARKTQRKTAEEDRTARERLIQSLDERLNLPGTKVTRTATPEEFDSITKQIENLKAKVETPQGNAKQAVLQQITDLAALHGQLTAQMESGIAAPTMAEKVQGMRAKQGKGAVPAARQMDAKERYDLQRKIDATYKKYNQLVDTKVKPIREKIVALHQSLYTTEKAKTAEQERSEKKAAGEAQLDTLKRVNEKGEVVGIQVSRAVREAKRINEGDVRKEAQDSAELRKLARDLGREAPEYKAALEDARKQIDKFVTRYGKDDPRYINYKDAKVNDLAKLADSLGRKTVDYKRELATNIKVLQEALAGGEQTVASKRTVQETRAVRRAPTEERTGSPESRAATEKKTVREAGNRLTKTQVQDLIRASNKNESGTAYRTRETEGGTVDARQAADFMEKVQSKLPSNVKLVYAATPGKIPVALLKRMSEEGVNPTEAMVQGAVFRDGTILVVGDQHADLKDLEATVFHEIVGHYGIDTIIGIDRLQAYADKTDLRKLAEEIGGQKLVDEVIRTAQFNAAQGKSEAVQRLQVLREIIAHTEEARVTESFREKAGRWLKEFVGLIRAGMRDLGFTSSSVLSTSDVFYALKQSRKAFENKTIGPYRAADGEIAFRTKKEPTQYGASFIAKEPSIKDQLLGNIMGLTGRVQFVDKDAALSEAFKRGVANNVITSLEAQNAEFYLRFGQQRSQYAGQALTNGKLILRKGEGGGYVYDSVKGANMVEVAEALHKGKFANDSEAEAILTAYVAGERAKVKGWQKLNYENPALAEKEYNDVMRLLNSDKTKKDAVLEAARIYKEFNGGQIDFLVQTGAITPKLANELKSVPYIPYYRINSNSGNIELMVDKETPVRIGNVKTEPQLKELVGGNKNILPIFTSSVQNTFMLTDLALRNQMIKESAFLLRKMGIASALGEGSGPASDSTVRFKVNGKDHFVFIDKDKFGIPADLIIKGMEGIKTTMPAAIKMMGVPADILRKFVTRNPSYAIRQIVRDPLNAWLTTGTDATPVLSSFKELASMVAGRSDVENKLMRSGAISTNVFTGDQRDAAKFLKDISAGKSGWDKLIAKADAFAMQGDAATRAVIYKDSLAKGMSEQAALLRTLESMNFSRRGLSPSMQALSIVIPFFNAQIQGLDVLYRAYTGQMPFSEQLKIKQKMMARGLMIAAGTLAYAAMMSDDEAYKRAKPEERYGSWFVYLPGFDEPVRVPIPFELGYLFKALPEAIWDMASNDEKASKAVGGWLKLVAQTNPFTLPQAIKPLTEVYLGKSFFGGDIESQRESKMLAGERSRESTTEFAKLLGSVTGSETIKQITGKEGLSPIGIDYLIRGYTGGLGLGIVQLANPILNMEMKEDVAKPTLKASKTPFIGGLFQPVEGRGTLDEAYDMMESIQQTKGTFNRLVEQGKTAEAKAFAQEHADKLAAASVSGSVQQKLGDFAKFRRQVESSPRLTTEQKDEKLAQIDKAQTEYARAFIKAVDKTTRQ